MGRGLCTQGRLLSQGSETQTAVLSQVGWWAKGNTRGSCARRRSSQADCPAPSALVVMLYAAVLYNSWVSVFSMYHVYFLGWQEQFRAANYRSASRPLGPLTEAPVPALQLQHGHTAPAPPVARHRCCCCCCCHISSRQNMSTLCHPAFCGTTSLVNDPIRAFGTNG
ncbi:hypothetical protein COCCADRAFT_34390 [Bipolaris zeicola 26-R-13]|uniref:Uncharacterized protein n=1 Tax=Cochliobolus carbonum (strain 26-R-13) TaxID=930089 RepID=W6YF06_COCC2|nr:uncharacterized protein COCCADRAFT_34390 [Bipolaris zeicola 26-R-13]EUC36240.1 hypothetical protein COCCADRAFT_34390 [Bipolaris zeicola 26-R-13]